MNEEEDFGYKKEQKICECLWVAWQVRIDQEMQSLFCVFPRGHSRNSAAHETLTLPDASESQKTRTQCATSLHPPTPLIYCMVTKHADRQSKSRQPSLCSCLWRLTSTSDKFSLPCPQWLLQAHAGLSICKLCNWHVIICIHAQSPLSKTIHTLIHTLLLKLVHKETNQLSCKVFNS